MAPWGVVLCTITAAAGPIAASGRTFHPYNAHVAGPGGCPATFRILNGSGLSNGMENNTISDVASAEDWYVELQ